MKEKIYTIPVNEAFDTSDGCPFCTLYKKLEANELDIILGASMMEPDVRIKTNEAGFCRKHFATMLTMKNRLGLALMLESHFSHNIKGLIGGGLGKSAAGDAKKIAKLNHSCYVCGRIEFSFEKMMECAALLWGNESDFRKKYNSVKYFCLPHYARLLEVGGYMLSKKQMKEFYDETRKVVTDYAESLSGDISWFVKKFDYRYESEPWGTAKDSPDRALAFLRPDIDPTQ